MPYPVVPWVLELKASNKTTFELTQVADLKITNATLDPVLDDENGRSTVVLYITNNLEDSDDEDEEEDGEDSEEGSRKDVGHSPPQKLVLTSLTPGKIESTIHDIVITRPSTVVCEVIGKNTIHLSGYLYVPDGEQDSDSSDGDYTGGGVDMDDESESEEDYLDEMERDLEPDDSELDETMFGRFKDSGRFEEIESDEEGDEEDKKEKIKKVIEAPKKTETEEVTKKRPRESEDEEPAPKLSKKQRKKLMAQQAAAAVGAAEGSGKKKVEAPPQKKQKVEGGKAVPVQPDKKEAQPNGDSAAASKKGKEKEKEKPKGDKKEKETGKNAMDGKAPAVGKPVRYPNGLIITDTKTGTGATAKKGSRLAMRYIGKFSNGTVFDSNTSGRPFNLQLGKGDVIKGWDEGLVGMKVGGERRLVIPPNLGYGKQKIGGIPPNSTLTFEVKLLNIS